MKWGFHAVYEASFDAAIRRARELAFDYVQFDLNIPRFYVHDLPKAALKELRDRSRDSGVGITFHAVGDYVGLTMDIEPIRSAYVEHWKRIIDVAELLGSHHITFHPLSPPSFKRADSGTNDFETEYLTYYENVFKRNVACLEEHCETVLIAIENQKLGPAVRKGLEAILPQTTRVGLTLDIPKLYSSQGIVDSDSLSVFNRHPDRIVEIHVHDFDPGRMQHLEVGAGCVDFAEYASFFFNTEAWTTVEVRPAEAAARSRRRLVRDLGIA